MGAARELEICSKKGAVERLRIAGEWLESSWREWLEKSQRIARENS